MAPDQDPRRSGFGDDATEKRAPIAGTRSGSAIAYSTADAIYVRGVDLVNDLIGQVDFVTMMLFQMTGRRPRADELAVVNAVLVALMEHGLTPSSISARLIYNSSPDAMQSAIAAGLLGAGGVYLGSMEELARILQDGVRLEGLTDASLEAYCRDIVRQFIVANRHVPGFGHHIHRPDDPRAARLFAVAEDNGTAGRHVELVRILARAMDEAKGEHITLNATGAVAAVLSDLGYPWQILRGFALVARCAGLIGHILEEQSEPLGRDIWELVERAVPYRPTGNPPSGGHLEPPSASGGT